MSRKAVFVAATGQNVGKTTICLGMIAALQKKFPKLGFMKPVGQQHEEVEGGLRVDKDVVLFKEYFDLPLGYQDMSPVIFPRGFTRNYLDGKVDVEELKKKIVVSFKRIYDASDFTIIEGTGHVGVGSMLTLSNATVAHLLGAKIVLIAKGGLGSAFDELALNKALCDSIGIEISGVILNRVLEEKKAMIQSYIVKALDRWKIPLVGLIPFDKLLSTPCMEDFEVLFHTKLLSGEKYHYRHFETIRLVATSVETFKERLFPDQLIVTPATRDDIIETVLEYRKLYEEPEHGLILTGRHPPKQETIDKLKRADIPSLYAPATSYEAMRKITSFTAKIRREDTVKVEKAIALVEKSLNFDFFE